MTASTKNNLQPLQGIFASASQWLGVCLLAATLIGLFGSNANAAQVDEEVRMTFSFSETPWEDVIEFFTKRTGLAYQPTTKPPTGSFTWFSPKSYSIAEGMDLLNEALLREGITITRKGQMLVLQRLDSFDDRLLDTVSEEKIDSRGKYEVFRVIYDMNKIENMGIEEEVRAMIGQHPYSGYNKFPAMGQMVVIELGYRHREIEAGLEIVRGKQRDLEPSYSTYKMKNVSVDTLMTAVREFMDFPQDSFVSADELIKISVEQLGDTLRLAATEERRQEFLKIAAMIDIPAAEEDDNDPFERPYLRTYQPTIDPELAFKVIDSVLEGRVNVIMEMDENTGGIVIMGRKVDHDSAQHVLDVLERTKPDYGIIQLEFADSDDVLEKLQAFFRISEGEENSDAPVLYEDEDLNQIFVRGKPSDVELVKKMCADFDTSTTRESGPRTTSRFIEMDPADAEEAIDVLGDLFPSTGHLNELKIVMPEDRNKFKRRGVIFERERRDDTQDDGFPTREELQELLKRAPAELRPAPSQPEPNEGASYHPVDGYRFVSCPVTPRQEQARIGDTSSEHQDVEDIPFEQPTVPGAPIKVKWTSEGIRIDSLDLDALDDLEVLLRKRSGDRSKTVEPHAITLKHTLAEDIKAKLDQLFGLDGGGGGGGGGLGDAMSGVLKNVGGGGDLLAGMLGGGGGGGGSSAGIELESEDVFIQAIVRSNILLVMNATANDMDYILMLVDLYDEKDPPQVIDTVGEVFVIPVQHYDVQELAEMIQVALPTYIKGAGGQGNTQGQPNPAVQMRQMMQGLAGGKGKQGGGGSDEQVPTATLAADVRNSSLVLVGPVYIYDKVRRMVDELDQPEGPKGLLMLPNDGTMSNQSLQDALKAIFGDKIEFSNGDEDANGGASTGGKRTSSPRGNGKTTGGGEDPRAAIMRAIQNQSRGGGRTQGGGGARTQGGGGGGGRGNRGSRGRGR